MANVSGQATTYNLENFVGELFFLTAADAPFKSLASQNGIRRVASKLFTWQTTDNPNPSQPSNLEGADPTYEERDRSEVSNVVQIFQYGVEVSYTKLAAIGQLASTASPVLGTQPVSNEQELQEALKLDRAAEDMEVSFLTGTFQNPSDNLTGRQTRGVSTAISTNTVAAGTTDLSRDQIDTLLRTMHSNRAKFRRPTVFGTALQIQRLNDIYAFAPNSRTVGGVNIQSVITPFGTLDVVMDRHVTASELLILDMAFIKPVVMPIPGKGELFLEPKPASGASNRSMLYGEWGIQYGPERYHGKITGLTTS
ncbi:MAG: DUF5309 family protein [Acidimicrobiia bacterium]